MKSESTTDILNIGLGQSETDYLRNKYSKVNTNKIKYMNNTL